MEPYVGQIALYAFDFPPTGFAPCDGSLLPIQRYVPLFQAIGTSYGGNGLNDFALPNLPPVQPSGPHYCIALIGTMPR
jgi:microcystin-dependent protein